MNKNFFIDTLTAPAGDLITVYFKGGKTADFTTNIYNLLVTDPAVLRIISAETGELLFDREEPLQE